MPAFAPSILRHWVKIMSAFDTAPLLIFSGVGLVALAIGLLSRRYSLAALAVALAGLFAITTGSTWITTAGPIKVASKPTEPAALATPDLPLTTPNPPAGPEAPGAAIAEPPAAVQRAIAEIEGLKGALARERAARAEADEKTIDAEKRFATAAEKVALLDEQFAQADRERRETLEKNVADAREIENLKKALEKAESARPPVPPLPATPAPDDTRRKLEDGDTQHYATKPERELISGLKGAWYSIQLRQAGESWTFDDRQFVLADATEIKSSASRLRDDVLLPLSQAKKNWRLFVRGAADARPVSGPVGREIAYLPRLTDGTHAPNPTPHRVIVAVQNQELPTLRADWLREMIRPLLATVTTGEIDILENPPQPGHDRTAELVLFVEW